MGGKTHYVVQFLGRVVAKTYCGRYIDAEWVTGKMSEVTCLRCQKAGKNLNGKEKRPGSFPD